MAASGLDLCLKHAKMLVKKGMIIMFADVPLQSELARDSKVEKECLL